jgi:hypothetical protein
MWRCLDQSKDAARILQFSEFTYRIVSGAVQAPIQKAEICETMPRVKSGQLAAFRAVDYRGGPRYPRFSATAGRGRLNDTHAI